MAENVNLILSDKQVVPTEGLIFSLIGTKKILWQRIMACLADNYKDSAGQWNYYNDGHRWLFKMVRKKKTLFWLGMMEDGFRITFYFPDKAEPVIEGSDLPGKIKDEFKTAKKYGATRGVTITVNNESDVDNVLKLTALKNSIK